MQALRRWKIGKVEVPRDGGGWQVARREGMRGLGTDYSGLRTVGCVQWAGIGLWHLAAAFLLGSVVWWTLMIPGMRAYERGDVRTNLSCHGFPQPLYHQYLGVITGR